MKNVNKLTIYLCSILIFNTFNSLNAFGTESKASNEFQFQFSGPGCPTDNTKVVVDKEKDQLNIFTDKYYIETAGIDVLRVHCDFAMRFSAPPNKKLVLSDAVFRVINKLPNSSSSRIFGDFFISGTTSMSSSKTYQGKLENTDSLHFGSLETGCGESGIFRMNSSIVLTPSSTRETARSAISLIQLNGFGYKDCVK